MAAAELTGANVSREDLVHEPEWSDVLLSVAAAAALAGCAGNGEGLDENGRPVEEGGEPSVLTPDFASIQNHVLTPICTICHAGAAAPLGLRLDEASSYALLVGIPSVEVPNLLRVNPGSPDSSYLIRKLEGTAALGTRMPQGGPALPRSTILVIRQWILDGAPPPISLVSSAAAPVVNTVSPLAGAVVERLDLFVVAFSEEMDASLANSTTVMLERSGGDRTFGDGNDLAVPLASIARSMHSPFVLLARLATTLPPDTYRLTLRGTGGGALADINGRVLDGDADGEPGGDYQLTFTVGMPQ